MQVRGESDHMVMTARTPNRDGDCHGRQPKPVQQFYPEKREEMGLGAFVRVRKLYYKAHPLLRGRNRTSGVGACRRVRTRDDVGPVRHRYPLCPALPGCMFAQSLGSGCPGIRDSA